MDIVAVQFDNCSEEEFKILKIHQIACELQTEFSEIVAHISVSSDGAVFFV